MSRFKFVKFINHQDLKTCATKWNLAPVIKQILLKGVFAKNELSFATFVHSLYFIIFYFLENVFNRFRKL